MGRRLPLGSIFEPTAYVDISYSDVQGGPDDIFEENNSTIAWWLDGNINQDPLFTYPPPIPSELEPVSPEGFYLSQVAAGQSENSPCLNGGLGSPEDLDTQLGFKGSTRTDLIAEVDSDVTIELDPPLANPYDPDVVNMGYHYNADKTYNLTIRVESLTDFIAEPAQLRATQDGIDFVTATTTVREVSAGVVDLEAIILDSRYELVAWGNADDDASTALINTVTMNQDKTVIMVCDTINPLLKINIIGEGTVTTMVSGEEVDADMTFWDSDEVVHLEARPDNASESVRWTQTDDDALLSNFNQVTMTESKTVTVRFYEPTIRNVTGDFTDLQYAIDVAEENDIIIVHPGDYDPVQGWQFVIDKNIVIQGYNPDSLESVENTIIRSSFILESTDRSMVINGISIQDNTWVGGDGCPGADENCGYPLPDGDNGVDIEGVGITFLGDASATIKNCKIRDNIGIAGNGGDGGNVDDICGDGGWGGWARGAGVYIESGDPRFIRCDFIDNRVQGGGGGDGDQSDGCVTRGGSWDDPEEPYQDWDWPPPGGYQNFWKYSGYGGAVYCDENSRPEFSGCSFRGNIAEGGHTGRGSGAYSPIRPPQNLPDGWYKIDRYGGAVFVADGSQVLFTECVFENNEADTVGPLENYKDPARSPIVEEDPYFSYGGAIALEDDLETKAATVVTLKDCVFESGTAHHGGGVYAEHATLQVTDSDFTSNVASFGGAIYNVDSDVTVENTSFTGNAADITESQGGAVFAFDSNSVFTDVA
jgi:hypothetical protein